MWEGMWGEQSESEGGGETSSLTGLQSCFLLMHLSVFTDLMWPQENMPQKKAKCQ